MKGYRTLIFNIIGAILPVLETADLTNVLGLQGMALYGLALTVGNVVLRFFTTTPVTTK